MSETERAPYVPSAEESVETISPRTLKDEIDRGAGVTLLDVRDEREFEEWHIDGESVEVLNVPYDAFLDVPVTELTEAVPRGDPLVVVCAKGESSKHVARRLTAETDREAVSLESGMNGWATVYESREIERYDGPGSLYQYQRPSSGCLGYLLVSDGEAAVVDPLRTFTDRYHEDAAEHDAVLEYAIDTHVHADHVSGVRDLDGGSADGIIPEPATKRDIAEDLDLATIEDGETISVGEATITAVHTPGHTSGMTSYLVDDSVLLTGDGLFVESVARPDLETGSDAAPEAARLLYETIQERVLAFDDEVVVAGGHVSDGAEPASDGTYSATIGDLREDMDALSADEEAFVELVLSDMPPRPTNFEDIIATNLGQQDVGDEEAFRLELGPNNCATSQDALVD